MAYASQETDSENYPQPAKLFLTGFLECMPVGDFKCERNMMRDGEG